MTDPPRRERGAAMMVVMIVMAALMTAGGLAIYVSTSETRSTGYVSAERQALFCAEAGLAAARSTVTANYATWSQAHSLALADIDGDGTPDLVTGKRFMAHNGNDPDEFGPLGVYWYKLTKGAKPSWTMVGTWWRGLRATNSGLSWSLSENERTLSS